MDWLSIVVSVLAVGVAVWALRHSSRSADAAERSASSASRSAEAAEKSAEVQRLQMDRASERHDVDWEADRDGSTLRLRNIGSTSAHNVAARVTVNENVFEEAAEEVPAGDCLEVFIGQPVSEAEEAYRTTVRAMNQSGILYAGTPDINISARLTWESELGSPSSVVRECS